MASRGSRITIIFSLELLCIVFGTSTNVPCPPMIPKPPPKTPKHPPYVPPHPKCPRDTLKLSACGDWVGGLAHEVIGQHDKTECCSIVSGLADLDAAVCLCTAIKAKALGIMPVALTVLINNCGKKIPPGFKCA